MDAKETEYKGYRFRSRLEARWAVFFDALDIDYEYEPEGFVLSNGQSYLPDFYLPYYNVYVEVKHKNNNFISHPNNEMVTFGEHSKYGFFMDEATAKGYGVWFVFGDPMDAMLDKEHGGKGTNELFCNCECVLKAFESNNNKICSCGGKTLKVSECNKKMIVSGKVAALDKEFMITSFEPNFWTGTVKSIPFELMVGAANNKNDGTLKGMIVEDLDKTIEAFKKARQARFEHGEKPCINTTSKVSEDEIPF